MDAFYVSNASNVVVVVDVVVDDVDDDDDDDDDNDDDVMTIMMMLRMHFLFLMLPMLLLLLMVFMMMLLLLMLLHLLMMSMFLFLLLTTTTMVILLIMLLLLMYAYEALRGQMESGRVYVFAMLTFSGCQSPKLALSSASPPSFPPLQIFDSPANKWMTVEIDDMWVAPSELADCCCHLWRIPNEAKRCRQHNMRESLEMSFVVRLLLAPAAINLQDPVQRFHWAAPVCKA